MPNCRQKCHMAEAPTGFDCSSLFWYARPFTHTHASPARVYNRLIPTETTVPRSIPARFLRISATVAEKPRILRRRSLPLRPAEPALGPGPADPVAAIRGALEQPAARGEPGPHEGRKRKPQGRAEHYVGDVVLSDQDPACRNPGGDRVKQHS